METRSEAPVRLGAPSSERGDCVYCKSTLGEGPECSECGIVLHAECAAEVGGACPTLGCDGALPGEGLRSATPTPRRGLPRPARARPRIRGGLVSEGPRRGGIGRGSIGRILVAGWAVSLIALGIHATKEGLLENSYPVLGLVLGWAAPLTLGGGALCLVLTSLRSRPSPGRDLFANEG